MSKTNDQNTYSISQKMSTENKPKAQNFFIGQH